MPEPAVLVAAVIVVLLAIYVLLGGADYGAGVWDLLAGGDSADSQRTTIARAIGPVWEANHVWLIVAVVVLFNAFPAAFARVGTLLHVPLGIALAGIIFRGSAFVFRAYGPPDQRHVRRWGVVFAVASTITPVLLGVVVGGVTEGRLVVRDGAFLEAYVEPWLTPFSLSVGAFALVLFAYLAAVYLTLEARDPATVEAFRRRALAAAVLTGVMALIVFLLAGGAPHIRAGLTRSPWAAPLHVATGAAALAALACLWTRRFWFARAAAAAQAALIIAGWALAQYPYLIRPDLTIAATAAPPRVLVLLLQLLAVGAVVLLPSLVYLFRVFGPRETGGSGAS